MFAVVLYLLPLVLTRSPYVLFALTLTLCYAIPAIGAQSAARLHRPGFARPHGVRRHRRLCHRAADEERHCPASRRRSWPATIAAGLVGALVGIPCLRLRSHFFIIVTLAVGLMLYLLFNNLDWLTGGAAGLPGRAAAGPDRSRLRDRRSTPAGRVLFPCGDRCFCWSSLCNTPSSHSDFGRSLAAIRQDETLAREPRRRRVRPQTDDLRAFGGDCRSRRRPAGRVPARGRAAILRISGKHQSRADRHRRRRRLVVWAARSARCCSSRLPEVLRVADDLRLVLFGAALLALALFAPRGLCGLGCVRNSASFAAMTPR